MTTKLEKQFFDTFGIKPYFYEYIIKTNRKEQMLTKEQFINFVKSEQDYLFVIPYKVEVQITDRILLELICINNKNTRCIQELIIPRNLKLLKKSTLKRLIENSKVCFQIKQQVRTLFKEQ